MSGSMSVRPMPRRLISLLAAVALLAGAELLATMGFVTTGVAAAGTKILVYDGNGAVDEGYTLFGTAAVKTVDTQTVLPADLSNYTCVVLPVNGNGTEGAPFSDADKAAFASYIAAGGRLIALGEFAAFSGSIATMNDLAAALSADVLIVSDTIDSGFNVTTDIIPSVYTTGVRSLVYAATSQVTIAVSGDAVGLARTITGSKIFMAADPMGPGLFVLSGDSNPFSNNSGTGYSAHDNGVLVANLCGASDTIAPTASPTQSPLANGAGWNNTDVTVTWNWTDNQGGSGIDNANCTTSSTSTGEGNPITLGASCKDLAGNTGTASYNVKVDKTKPTLNPVVSPNPVQLNGSATVTSGAADALSGLASQSCGALDTSSVGSKSVTCTATDNAGNTNSASAGYIVEVTQTCLPTQTCTAQTTSPDGTTATITGSPGSTITAFFSTLEQANFTACPGYSPPNPNSVLTFNVTNSRLPKLIKFVEKVLAGPVRICWNAPTTFRQRGGTWAQADPKGGFTGLLPDCLMRNPTLPCVSPPLTKNGITTLFILASPGDPHMY